MTIIITIKKYKLNASTLRWNSYRVSRECTQFVLITDVPKRSCFVIRERDNVWDALDEVSTMSGAEWERKGISMSEGFTY